MVSPRTKRSAKLPGVGPGGGSAASSAGEEPLEATRRNASPSQLNMYPNAAPQRLSAPEDRIKNRGEVTGRGVDNLQYLGDGTLSRQCLIPPGGASLQLPFKPSDRSRRLYQWCFAFRSHLRACRLSSCFTYARSNAAARQAITVRAIDITALPNGCSGPNLAIPSLPRERQESARPPRWSPSRRRTAHHRGCVKTLKSQQLGELFSLLPFSDRGSSAIPL